MWIHAVISYRILCKTKRWITPETDERYITETWFAPSDFHTFYVPLTRPSDAPM